MHWARSQQAVALGPCPGDKWRHERIHSLPSTISKLIPWKGLGHWGNRAQPRVAFNSPLILALWSTVLGVRSLGARLHPPTNKLCVLDTSSPLCTLAGSKILMPHHLLECRWLDQLWDLGKEGNGKICLLRAGSSPRHLSHFIHSAYDCAKLCATC